MFSFFQSIFYKVTTVIATAAIAIGLVSAPKSIEQPINIKSDVVTAVKDLKPTNQELDAATEVIKKKIGSLTSQITKEQSKPETNKTLPAQQQSQSPQSNQSNQDQQIVQQVVKNQQQQIQNQQTQIQNQQTQIQNQQNHINSIQQQTNTQSSTQIQNSQIVQQPILSSSLSSSLISLNNNSLKATSAEFVSNISDSYKKPIGFSWELYVNDQRIYSDYLNFVVKNLIPETEYSYRLVYKEPGREDSIKIGTFKTLSKSKTVSCSIGASWQNNLNLNFENNSNIKYEYTINCDPGDFVSIKLLSVDLGYWLNYANNFLSYIPIIVEVSNSDFYDKYLLDPISDGFGKDGLAPDGVSINFMTHQLNLHDTLIRKSDFIQSGGWLLAFKIITQNPNNGDGDGQGSPFRFKGQLFNLTFLDELGNKYIIRIPRNSYDGVYLDY